MSPLLPLEVSRNMKWEPPCALDAPVVDEGAAVPRVHWFLPEPVQPHVPDSNVQSPATDSAHLPNLMTKSFVVHAQLARLVEPAVDLLPLGCVVHLVLPDAP